MDCLISGLLNGYRHPYLVNNDEFILVFLLMGKLNITLRQFKAYNNKKKTWTIHFILLSRIS